MVRDAFPILFRLFHHFGGMSMWKSGLRFCVRSLLTMSVKSAKFQIWSYTYSKPITQQHDLNPTTYLATITNTHPPCRVGVDDILRKKYRKQINR